ncbi:7615_t:CDS:2, partial [Racocetra persica]
MVCEHFGQPEATKSKDQKKKTTTKRVGYTWQINLSCPEKKNPNKVIYISKLINKHQNHELDQARYNFQENQIRKALEEKYYVKVYMPVLRQVIQQFHPKSCDQANNASKLYEELLNKKEADPRWY